MSRHILVVDDDRQMVQTLRDILELSGWKTAGAHTGAEAVIAVQQETYDAVLMDIRMPGMDGVAALKAIRTHRPGARVVLMTAYSAPELIREAEREGALRVLPKPVTLAPLLDLLQASLHESRSVLVVDDEPDFLRTLTDVLSQRGYDVISARTLETAIDAMRERDPAAVLLHLRLDHIAPRTAVLAIHDVNPTVALILYSGQPATLDETAAAVPRSWVHARLQKPFPVETLTGLLDDVIAH